MTFNRLICATTLALAACVLLTCAAPDALTCIGTKQALQSDTQKVSQTTASIEEAPESRGTILWHTEGEQGYRERDLTVEEEHAFGHYFGYSRVRVGIKYRNLAGMACILELDGNTYYIWANRISREAEYGRLHFDVGDAPLFDVERLEEKGELDLSPLIKRYSRARKVAPARLRERRRVRCDLNYSSNGKAELRLLNLGSKALEFWEGQGELVWDQVSFQLLFNGETLKIERKAREFDFTSITKRALLATERHSFAFDLFDGSWTVRKPGCRAVALERFAARYEGEATLTATLFARGRNLGDAPLASLQSEPKKIAFK